jgi:hypothetical protein
MTRVIWYYSECKIFREKKLFLNKTNIQMLYLNGNQNGQTAPTILLAHP